MRDSYITVRAWECGEMRESHGQMRESWQPCPNPGGDRIRSQHFDACVGLVAN